MADTACALGRQGALRSVIFERKKECLEKFNSPNSGQLAALNKGGVNMKASDYFEKRLPRETLVAMYVAKDQCARVWKQAAKENRAFYNNTFRVAKQWKAKHHEAEATAARRLALLRKVELGGEGECLFCGVSEVIWRTDGHYDDCELAKELSND
jgi:hypothetical protein